MGQIRNLGVAHRRRINVPVPPSHLAAPDGTVVIGVASKPLLVRFRTELVLQPTLGGTVRLRPGTTGYQLDAFVEVQLVRFERMRKALPTP